MPYPDDEFRLSDWLTGPTASILIPALSGLAGALKPVPNRWGVGRGGISGAIEGGLGGLGLVSQMQEQNRKLKEQDTLKKAVGTLSAATEPTTVTRNEVNPASVLPEFKYQSGQAGDYRLSELPDFSKHALPEEPLFTSRETTEEKPLFTPAQQRLLQTVGTVAPQTALSAASQAIFKPPQEDFTLGENQVRYGPGGKVIARGPLKPEKLAESPFAKPAVPTTKDYTAESIRKWRETTTPENPLGDQSILAPRTEEKLPPSMTDNDALAIEAAVNKDLSLTKRQLALLQTDDPETGRTIVQEMARIKKTRQVDTRTAMAEALAGFKQTQRTGRESRIFLLNPKTNEIEDAVSLGMPEQEALKKGGRLLGESETRVLKMGDAAVESLRDFEASARSVLGKDPGLANMTWQKFMVWVNQKQSKDPEVALFQTQTLRTLPLLLQSLGMSANRLGVTGLKFEAPALPNSGQTVGVGLKLLERDIETVRKVQRSLVSGKYGATIATPATAEGETAEEVRRRLLGY